MIEEINGDKCFKVLDQEKYIFFYFGASWCGPCQQIFPKIKSLSDSYDNNIISFYKIDIDLEENKLFTNKCEIKVVPSFLLFNGRNFINRLKGNNIEGVKNMINNVLFPLTIQEPYIMMNDSNQQLEEKNVNPYEENKKIFNKERLFSK